MSSICTVGGNSLGTHSYGVGLSGPFLAYYVSRLSGPLIVPSIYKFNC